MSNTIVVLLGLGIAPFAIFFALRRPIVFPLGLYVMTVPFDALLGTTLTITRMIAIVTAGTLIFSMIAQRRVLAPPKSWVAWAAYICLASLSALWTIDPTNTMLVLGQIVQLFLFYTILAVYPVDRRDVRVLGAIIVLSGVVLSAVGLFGFVEGTKFFGNRLSIQMSGVILDPNHYAASLLMPVALAVGTFFETRVLWLRLTSAASMLIIMPAIFLTGSRGGLIALAVMLLYLAWRTRFRLQILILMALGGVTTLFLPTVWERFSDKGLSGGSGRTDIWEVGRIAFKDHWLIGAGIGGFQAAYNHALQLTYQQVFQGWSRPAHNAYLSAAVELGVFGAALLVYAWWRSWIDSRGNVVIEASIIGLAVASYFLDVLFFKYLWLAFAMAALVKNAAEPKYLRGTKPAVAPGPRQQFAAVSPRNELLARSRAWRGRPRPAPLPNPENIVSNQ